MRKETFNQHFSFLFYCLLNLILLYSSFVSAYISFFRYRHFDFLTLLFVFSLILLTLLTSYQTYRFLKKLDITVKNKFRLNKKNIVGLISIIILTVGTAYFHVHSQYPRGLHAAEFGQYSQAIKSSDVIDGAWREQQVPLDYYFSAFSHTVFGKGKFSIRFHAMSFYLILSFLLPLGLWFLSSSIWITLMSSLLFLSNHTVTLHSVDGRPLSLVLLTGFLFLFFYLLILHKERESRNLLSIEFLSIVSSQYLFVMSIGLQPVVLIISLFATSFPFLLMMHKGEKIKFLLLSHLIVGILSLPFYIKMISFGKSCHKFSEITVEKLITYVTNLDLLVLFQKFFHPSYGQLKYFFLVLVAGSLALVFIKKKKRWPSVTLTLIMLSTSIMFIFAIDFIFTILINWELHRWYFILIALLLIFFATLALKDFIAYLDGKKIKIPIISLITILFSWNLFSQFVYIKDKSRFWYPYKDNNVEKAYHYVKQKGSSSDFLMPFSLTQLPILRSSFGWRIESVYSTPNRDPKVINATIKVTESPPFFHEMTRDTIPFIDWKKDSHEKNQKIFFITENDLHDDKAYFVLSSFMDEVRIGRLSIFEWIVKGEKKEEMYKKFLMKLVEKTPHRYRAPLYETLIYYACRNKNYKKFHLLLEDYRKLEPYLDEVTDDAFKLRPKFSLKRRWMLFKERKYCMEDG